MYAEECIIQSVVDVAKLGDYFISALLIDCLIFFPFEPMN